MDTSESIRLSLSLCGLRNRPIILTGPYSRFRQHPLQTPFVSLARTKTRMPHAAKKQRERAEERPGCPRRDPAHDQRKDDFSPSAAPKARAAKTAPEKKKKTKRARASQAAGSRCPYPCHILSGGWHVVCLRREHSVRQAHMHPYHIPARVVVDRCLAPSAKTFSRRGTCCPGPLLLRSLSFPDSLVAQRPLPLRPRPRPFPLPFRMPFLPLPLPFRPLPFPLRRSVRRTALKT